MPDIDLPHILDFDATTKRHVFLVGSMPYGKRTIAETFEHVDAPEGFRKALAVEIMQRWNAHAELAAALRWFAGLPASACHPETRAAFINQQKAASAALAKAGAR